MNRRAYGLNGILISAVGEYVEVFLNGTQLKNRDGDKRMHIGSLTAKGDMWIVNGPWTNTVQTGAITHYDGFRVFKVVGNAADAAMLAQELSAAHLQGSKDMHDSEDMHDSHAETERKEYNPNE